MTGATSPQATTSTPESSEAPRENRAGGHYESRVAGNDFSAVESVWVDETPELTPERFDAVRGAKVSSPELASLAAKYLDFTINDPAFAQVQADVRALAASVLAQAEGTPRK